MEKFRRLILAAGTCAAAFSIGYVMQNTSLLESVLGTGPEPAVARSQGTPLQTPAVMVDGHAVPPAELELAMALPAPPARKVAEPTRAETILPLESRSPAIACPVSLTAETSAAAMVNLTLAAECLPNERVTLHHNGMMLTEVTDESGTIKVALPALSEKAVFMASFAVGGGASASVDVPSVALYDRVVLQWKGRSGLQIHALEFGSEYFEDGHVWNEATRDIEAVSEGAGGFLTRLGAADAGEAHMAEVYTFPSALTKKSGEVALSVEAEITDQNCGRKVEAQTIERHADGTLKVQDVILPIPDCDAGGSFLVLKNLLEDLKIAAK